MKKFTIYLFIIVAVSMLVKTGCSDINSGDPAFEHKGITSIIPARAPFGARVVIGGKGFESTKKVLFNGTEAPLEAVSDSAILTRVPMNATSGPIEIITAEQTFTGPDFTVDDSQNLFLSIQKVTPTKIRVLDTIRITGTGFTTAIVESGIAVAEKRAKPAMQKNMNNLQNKEPALNKEGGIDEMNALAAPETAKKEFRKAASDPEVYINDIAAKTLSISDTVIVAEIPQDAQSGLVSVIVEADTAIGPQVTIFKHAITGITPTTGATGDEVVIEGSSFSTRASDHTVTFNGTPATILNAAESELLVRVPQGATSGNVEVDIFGYTVSGPVFTVQSAALPAISSIQPESGTVGTEVTISGSNFGSTIAENTVLFNGVEAQIISATPTQIVAEVPEGATGGPVEVRVGNEVAEGPVFEVITTGTLTVHVFTSGSSLDPDGYLITIDDAKPERVAINDTLTKSGLEPGSYQVSISDIETNCFTTADFPNPRMAQITAGETTVIEYYINCEGANEPPVASFTTFCENLTCNFDASASSDSDGSIESYAWIFGDGSSATGQAVSHSYEASGDYTVQLTVTDNEGAIGTEEQIITITQPEITGIFPAFGEVGTEVAIIGTGFSSTKSDNKVSFVSASGRVNAPVKTASETDITVDVPEGAITGPIQLTVNGYTMEGPEFRVEVYGALEVITSTVGDSLDPNGYQINIQGVGNQSIQVNDTLAYDKLKVGSYDVGISDIASNCYLDETIPNPMTVNVTENNTARASFELYCMNPNQPPVASFTATCTNLTCNFDASGSTDSDGYIAGFEWVFGDGTSGSGENTTKSYEASGTYNVQLTVTDNGGLTNTISKNVTVAVPEITDISPKVGPNGSLVTITGDNFAPTALENIVTFNGTRAELNSVSKTQIEAFVPGMASTGPVSVEVDGYKAVGPIFTIQYPGTLEIATSTTGQYLDPDGYTVSVTGQADRSIDINDTIQYSNIYDTEVEVSLSGIEGNCQVEGQNPRTVSLDNSDRWGFTTFEVTCVRDLRGSIVYMSDADGNKEIYQRDAYAVDVNNISNTSAVDESQPAISPDGLSIAYVSGGMLYVMKSEGGGVQQLTKDGVNASPSWSPKGDKIVFERSEKSGASDLYIIHADGSGLQNITNTPGVSERDPDWSPDGSKIVYASNRYSAMNIFTILPDGTGETQITDSKADDVEPEWSPSMNRIAFTRTEPGNSSKIYIMNSDGSSQSRLTGSLNEESHPTWSPDGSMMAYEVFNDGYYHIYVFSVDYQDIIRSSFTKGNDRYPHWNFW